MSPATDVSATLASRAAVFAALGDPSRLAMVGRLTDGAPQSISRLSQGSGLTRQAITKHLRVLETAGVVRRWRNGRETLFMLEPQQINSVRDYLDEVAAQWDSALARLKAFAEK